MFASVWNERYAEDGYAYGLEPNDFLIQMADRLDGPVLCLAEGEGRNSVFLAQRGLEVHGVDLSDVGVNKTRELAVERGVVVHAEVADLAHYDLGENRWGAVVSIFAHMPPPVRRDLHRRVVEGLRPGGLIVLEAYTPKQLEHGTGGPPAAAMMMTLELLREELRGLEFLHGQELEREVHEGSYHDGLAAVVQVLAKKPS